MPQQNGSWNGPAGVCRVCGAPLYTTDKDFHEITYHCSSREARFWDFDRGTEAQALSKEHWDTSRVVILVPAG